MPKSIETSSYHYKRTEYVKLSKEQEKVHIPELIKAIQEKKNDYINKPQYSTHLSKDELAKIIMDYDESILKLENRLAALWKRYNLCFGT